MTFAPDPYQTGNPAAFNGSTWLLLIGPDSGPPSTPNWIEIGDVQANGAVYDSTVTYAAGDYTQVEMRATYSIESGIAGANGTNGTSGHNCSCCVVPPPPTDGQSCLCPDNYTLANVQAPLMLCYSLQWTDISGGTQLVTGDMSLFSTTPPCEIDYGDTTQIVNVSLTILACRPNGPDINVVEFSTESNDTSPGSLFAVFHGFYGRWAVRLFFRHYFIHWKWDCDRF